MDTFKYTWKHGICFSSHHELSFLKPLREGMIFADIVTGEVYLVFRLYAAGEHDRDVAIMPEQVCHTWSRPNLSEEELKALRQKHKYDEELLKAWGHPKEQFHLLE